MSDIQIYKDSIINSYEDLQNVGKALVASGYFDDVRSISQAMVKVMAGREIGLGPFASMRGVYVIKGNPAYEANVMASMVKKNPLYDYRVVHLDDKVCEIAFYQRVDGKWEDIGRSKFTIEDAQRAGTQNLTRFPRNMLFARALSNGVKWFCPDVMMGQTAYVPEEMEGLEEDKSNYVEVVPENNVVYVEEQTQQHTDNVAEVKPEPTATTRKSRPLSPQDLLDMLHRKALKCKPTTFDQDEEIRFALSSYFDRDENKRRALQTFLLGTPHLNSKAQPADGRLKMAVYEWLKPGGDNHTIDKDAAAEIDQIMVYLSQSPQQSEAPSALPPTLPL